MPRKLSSAGSRRNTEKVEFRKISSIEDHMQWQETHPEAERVIPWLRANKIMEILVIFLQESGFCQKSESMQSDSFQSLLIRAQWADSDILFQFSSFTTLRGEANRTNEPNRTCELQNCGVINLCQFVTAAIGNYKVYFDRKDRVLVPMELHVKTWERWCRWAQFSWVGLCVCVCTNKTLRRK